MDKPGPFSQCTWETFTAVTLRQLEELWPSLAWPDQDQPLPVLDVGCGPGDIAAKYLASRVPEGTRIVACDVCPKMLDYANDHNSRPGVITYLLFDAMAEDVETTAVWRHGPYSKVFALMLLHWLPDNRVAIRNIRKLLSPGGEAIFVVVPKVAIWGAYEAMVEDPRWKQYMQDLQKFISPYHHSPDPAAQLRQMMEDAGLQVTHCWCGPLEVEYQTDDEIREFLVSVNPFLHRMPEELKGDFIEEVLQLMYKLNGLRKEEDFCGRGTRVVYSYTSMVAVGRKVN